MKEIVTKEDIQNANLLEKVRIMKELAKGRLDYKDE